MLRPLARAVGIGEVMQPHVLHRRPECSFVLILAQALRHIPTKGRWAPTIRASPLGANKNDFFSSLETQSHFKGIMQPGWIGHV